MTTDDGLKGLTDEQSYQLWRAMWRTWSELSVGEDVSVALPKSARAWLAANVHDSGDGVSLASISIGLQNFYDSQAHLHEGSNNTHSAKLIHVNEAMQFILRADAAILAEKGEV